jgi:hypothetical protein
MAAPMRTLAAGVAAAFLERKDVYVSEGVFNEVLVVRNGVSVYGGYDPSWERSPANLTKITGTDTVLWAAVADGIATETTVQLVTLTPSAPFLPGESSYGLVGYQSPSLTLDHVTVVAAPGVAGQDGANGIAGLPGGNADGSRGGTSPVAHNGGDGGGHGYSDNSDGSGGPGTPGLPTVPDEYMRLGGTGGLGGQGGGSHTPGQRGGVGDAGVFRGDGVGGTAVNAAADHR